MSGGNCHIKGKERGPFYEIKCVKDIIIAKEAKKQDASFERELLKAWSKEKSYQKECQEAILSLV